MIGLASCAAIPVLLVFLFGAPIYRWTGSLTSLLLS
jgi:hypothetical protein